MGMPHQQQQPQQAVPANYQQMGGYPPGYSSAMAMQQKQGNLTEFYNLFND